MSTRALPYFRRSFVGGLLFSFGLVFAVMSPGANASVAPPDLPPSTADEARRADMRVVGLYVLGVADVLQTVKTLTTEAKGYAWESRERAGWANGNANQAKLNSQLASERAEGVLTRVGWTGGVPLVDRIGTAGQDTQGILSRLGMVPNSNLAAELGKISTAVSKLGTGGATVDLSGVNSKLDGLRANLVSLSASVNGLGASGWSGQQISAVMASSDAVRAILAADCPPSSDPTLSLSSNCAPGAKAAGRIVEKQNEGLRVLREVAEGLKRAIENVRDATAEKIDSMKNRLGEAMDKVKQATEEGLRAVSDRVTSVGEKISQLGDRLLQNEFGEFSIGVGDPISGNGPYGGLGGGLKEKVKGWTDVLQCGGNLTSSGSACTPWNVKIGKWGVWNVMEFCSKFEWWPAFRTAIGASLLLGALASGILSLVSSLGLQLFYMKDSDKGKTK